MNGLVNVTPNDPKGSRLKRIIKFKLDSVFWRLCAYCNVEYYDSTGIANCERCSSGNDSCDLKIRHIHHCDPAKIKGNIFAVR